MVKRKVKVKVGIPNRHNFKYAIYKANVYGVLGAVYSSKEDIREGSFGGSRIRDAKVTINDSLFNKIQPKVNIIKIPKKNDESDPLKVTFNVELPKETPGGTYYLRLIQVSANGETMEPIMDFQKAYKYIIESMRRNTNQNKVHEIVQEFDFKNKSVKGIENSPQVVDAALEKFENHLKQTISLHIGDEKKDVALLDLMKNIIEDFKKISDDKQTFSIKNVDKEIKQLVRELKRLFLKEQKDNVFKVLNENMNTLVRNYPGLRNTNIVQEIEPIKNLDDNLNHLVDFLNQMEDLAAINTFSQLKKVFSEFYGKFNRFIEDEKNAHNLLQEMMKKAA